MTDAQPRRIALIDRPWAGHRSVVLVTPLTVKPIAEIRAMLAEFLRQHPQSPLACRLDAASGRWVPVPAAERESHLDRILISAADPDPADVEGHIAEHLETEAAHLPLVIVVSPTSILSQTDHAVGDLATLTRMIDALAQADLAALAALTRRTPTSVPVKTLVKGLRSHYRDWAGYVRARTGPPAFRETGDAVPLRPAFAGMILGNDALRAITRWRNANARGVSLTCVLTSAVHQALRAHGIPMHDAGFYTLLDMRALLPESPDPRWGNLAKSLYLSADVADPRSVEASLREARDTQRTLPATVVGAVTSALNRAQPNATHQRPVSPVLLTFNSVPTLPGLSELPWLSEQGRRFYGFGPSLGLGDISVSTIRLREYMEVTASFDETTVSTETMRRALAALADPAALLGRECAVRF